MVDLTIEGAKEKVLYELREAGAERIWYIGDAFRLGMTMDEIHNITMIDNWFLVQIEDLILEEKKLAEGGLRSLDEAYLNVLSVKVLPIVVSHLLWVFLKRST